MAEVRLEHVDRTYKGEVEAVKDLNLTIQDGEFLALLGPSGCGKTSTLRMIVGLEPITAGDIYIGGRRVNNVEPKDRDVALAFETYALYPPLTIRENINFCLRARKLPAEEIDRRVAEVAGLLEIEHILDKKPGELGGGEKQRVSLARALIRQPAVFLMDEPLSHLDASQRSRMRTELKRLHADIQTTTVLVTHDQLEAVAMAERIAIMNYGELQQVGNVDEVYNEPANEFVAGFVGEPPMNFLPCEPVSEKGEFKLRAVSGNAELSLPSELADRIRSKSPNYVNVGIRPIDMGYSFQPQTNGLLDIRGKVYAFEGLGEEGQLAVEIGDRVFLVVTLPFVDCAVGDDVWITFGPDDLHLFDADTTLRI